MEYTVEIEHDENHEAPWQEEDGHGPVSDWTTRDKEPGELVLSQDGLHSRYYDFAEACRIALRDGWDSQPFNTGSETPKEQAAKAARADFERMCGWCMGEWDYVGVVVRPADACRSCGPMESVWGIESDAGAEYLDQVAEELKAELADQLVV